MSTDHNLSGSQCAQLAGLLEERTRIARLFLAGVVLLFGLGMLRLGCLPTRSGMADTTQVWVIGAITAVGLGVALYWWGFRRVIALRRDLEGKVFVRHRGSITKMSSTKNNYGQTITRATVNGIEHLTTESQFEEFNEGSEVEVDFLPASRTPVAVRALC